MSYLSPWQVALWAASLLAQLYLVSVIIRNRIWFRFPLFSVYFFINFTVGLCLAALYFRWGTAASQSWYFYWAGQGVVILLRILAGVEIYAKALSPYRGIWALAWRLLAAIGIFGIVRAVVQTYAQHPSMHTFVYLGERHLEFASAVTLLAFLLFCRYYSVSLGPTLKAIAVGLGFFSIVQILNDSLLNQWLSQYVPLWRWLMVVSFDCTLAIWWFGLRVPEGAAIKPPVLYSKNVYDEFSPQMNGRLRVLNDRLTELLKS
jgi:hypothetical protein